MSVTPNNTLPAEWSASTEYKYGETCYYGNIIYKDIWENGINKNKIPPTSTQYWKAIDIYIKDETVMPHGHYSGDESFWDRDNIYIDSEGYLYLNNENTGINVRGPEGHVTLDFATLTPEQIEQLRGPRGIQGTQGPTGPEGPRGPEGYVTLTPEQIAILKGEPGKSAYQSWLDQGHTGTEADFVNWLRSGIIQLDTELDANSPNGITNAAITQAFQSYRTQVNELLHLMDARVQDLENRLQSIYNGDTIYFRFGVTPEGKYGYYLSETSNIVPFDGDTQEQLSGNTVFRSDPQIFQSRIEQGDELINTTLLNTQLTEPSSIEGSVSRELEDPTTLYATNVEAQSLEEMFDAYIYIFKNGRFTEEGNVNLYSMNYTIPGNITSKHTESIEGIYFPPGTIGEMGSKLYIEVAPVHSGDTIRYQIGYYTDSRGQLPNLVDPGTYRTDYENGSFNTNTIIEYPIQTGRGYYFASLQSSEYKIKTIYLS